MIFLVKDHQKVTQFFKKEYSITIPPFFPPNYNRKLVYGGGCHDIHIHIHTFMSSLENNH
jgi:hypothetical protein